MSKSHVELENLERLRWVLTNEGQPVAAFVDKAKADGMAEAAQTGRKIVMSVTGDDVRVRQRLGYVPKLDAEFSAAIILAMINDLRAEEGDSVTICCDNPEGPPNNAVHVSASWNDWKDERFEGNTLEAALTAACFAKAERSGK